MRDNIRSCIRPGLNKTKIAAWTASRTDLIRIGRLIKLAG